MRKSWKYFVALLATFCNFAVLAVDGGSGGASVPKSGNLVLHTLLTPVGKAGVFLLDQIAAFLNFTKGAVAGLIGVDVNGMIYTSVFIVVWMVILIFLWIWIREFHGKFSDEMSKWGWVRFLATASGFTCVTFHFFSGNTTGTGFHPDDYWQLSLVPVCGLLISLAVAFIYARHVSGQSRSFARKAMLWVSLDFAFGFIMASFFKVSFWIIVLFILCKVGELIAMLPGGGKRSDGFFDE